MIQRRRGQHLGEIVILLSIVLAAVMGMQTYVKRGLQARLRNGINAGVRLAINATQDIDVEFSRDDRYVYHLLKCVETCDSSTSFVELDDNGDVADDACAGLTYERCLDGIRNTCVTEKCLDPENSQVAFMLLSSASTELVRSAMETCSRENYLGVVGQHYDYDCLRSRLFRSSKALSNYELQYEPYHVDSTMTYNAEQSMTEEKGENYITQESVSRTTIRSGEETGF
jgi:hypothetical protein